MAKAVICLKGRDQRRRAWFTDRSREPFSLDSEDLSINFKPHHSSWSRDSGGTGCFCSLHFTTSFFCCKL